MNKNNFYFSINEQKLIARYYRDIKLNYTCKRNWFTLSAAERKRICQYRAIWNHPEKYNTKTHASAFISEEALILSSDTDKITKFFMKGACPDEEIYDMVIDQIPKDLFTILRDCALTGDEDFIWLAKLVQMMNDAGDSNICFSAGNIGVNIIANTIDIVDIEADRSIATLKLEVK